MDKQISKLRIYLFILGFAFFVQVAFSILFFRHSNLLHSSSLRSIDSLITEVGDLKNENLLLDLELNSQNQFNSFNQEFLEQIDEKITDKINSDVSLQNELYKYQGLLEQEKINLSSQYFKLNNLLNQKDGELTAFKEKEQLQTKVEETDKDTLVFLLLGQNQKLTDSILLAFVNPVTAKTTLISIPRDLYYDGRKINEYLTLYGPEKLKSVLTDITGFNVDKYLEIDFLAFTEIIDSLGGIDIEIDQKIVDTSYPDGKGGYKTVNFEPGMEKMNGERALEYVRSRKSTSDFDRSLRQHKVLIAIKEKLKINAPLNNINFYLSLFQNIQDNLQTDLNVFEALQYFDLYKDHQLYAGNVLSNENFLYSAKSSSGQSILLPQNGSFLDFQKRLLELI